MTCINCNHYKNGVCTTPGKCSITKKQNDFALEMAKYNKGIQGGQK